MSSRGLKLAVPPEMKQNPCLELNNGDSSRVLCPKRIREYSLHVGDNSCRECHVGSKISGCFVFSALLSVLRPRMLQNPSRIPSLCLPPISPCSGNWGLRFFASFGKEFPYFALLIIRVDLVEILA
ncbi:hypothetical protein GQ457_04G021390 [Hibiscus cannabinus]